MRIESGFQPTPFVEGHPYLSDPVLPSLLKRLIPEQLLPDIEVDLVRLGSEVTSTIRTVANRAEPPRLTQYNQWGQRIDVLQTSEAWRTLKAISQKEGIPGIFYERIHNEHSRFYGFCKALLLTGDTQEIFCPMSMTDGSARVIELMGNSQMKKDILARLISRDPSFAFTAGQWMTERPGGSDISQTETIATPTGETHPWGAVYKLDGFKWFSSATDSDVALALARTGSPGEGSRSLSLFLVPLRLPLIGGDSFPPPSPISNNIFVHRLKNKIGTHILPTAELSLESTEAYLLGTINQGVKSIASVLNITRIHSAIASIGNLRKCLAIAVSYSTVRKIGGGKQLLRDAPIHVSQLAYISLTYRALTHLIFGAVGLLGKVECGVAAKEEQDRLRLLTPTVKAFAAEKACTAMEEAMAALGGAGYMEENGIGRSIRDSLVEKIWEGTTTVLALDLVRAAKDSTALTSFINWGQKVTSSCSPLLRERLEKQLKVLESGIVILSAAYKAPIAQLVPRPALLLIGHVASSLYLLEHAIWSVVHEQECGSLDLEIFQRWVVEGGLADAIVAVKRAMEAPTSRVSTDSDIVYGYKVRL